MHIAAAASVAESVENPAKYKRNNVLGTRTLLHVCRELGVRKVIFSSSCATYGQPPTLPILEDTPQQPINPYGESKLKGELMMRQSSEASGLRYVALRYFNACGADPDGELGERHDPETHLIPNVLKVASGEAPYFELFGGDYDTPDGTCIRDYVHVWDLAGAHVLALKYLIDGGASLVLNVGTGTGLSVREIVAAVTAITGRKVPVLTRPRRPGDPPTLFADVTRIREELGFETRYSDLGTIIETAAPFFNLEPQTRARVLAFG
jgi:UDP-arabinose 4-epimerase